VVPDQRNGQGFAFGSLKRRTAFATGVGTKPPPGADRARNFWWHEGEEAWRLFIIGGDEARVDVLGCSSPGDGYLFDSRLPRRFRNIGDVQCIVVSACTTPKFLNSLFVGSGGDPQN